MSKLEDLQPNAAIRGMLSNALVTVVNVQWFGSEALELRYKMPAGRVGLSYASTWRLGKGKLAAGGRIVQGDSFCSDSCPGLQGKASWRGLCGW
jgi:hypothetical protein